MSIRTIMIFPEFEGMEIIDEIREEYDPLAHLVPPHITVGNFRYNTFDKIQFGENTMKEIILSADGDSIVYLVPDAVANDLNKYCTLFNKWMKTSPDAKKYKIQGGFCYNEADFIDYLNGYVFPEQKSVLVKNLGWTDLGNNLPEEYQSHLYFNF